MHALVHPGLRFLVLTGGGPATSARAALSLGGELARRVQARVAVLVPAPAQGPAASEAALQEAREALGAGIAALETRLSGEGPAAAVAEEVARRPCDLVILTLPPKDGVELAEGVLAAGHHHLLLAPAASAAGTAGRVPAVPARLLICVAVGEPGKEDVSFTGRLARHLGAEATILTVLPAAAHGSSAELQAERFLAGSARTLRRLGVPVATAIRHGAVRDEILAQIAEGGHDLLVLGAPLPGRDGRIELGGFVGRLLPALPNLPVLIVRSPEAVS